MDLGPPLRGDRIATNYSRGRAFEYRTRDKLKKMGAAYVMRAAQSKGIADLLALWPYYTGDDWPMCRVAPPWIVQVKYSINKGKVYLPGREAIELIALADVTGAVPVFARPGKNGRGVEFINLYSKEQIG